MSLFLVAVMWIVMFFSDTLDLSLSAFAVRPKTWRGLAGVLFSPFIHASYKHLLSNTFPFIVLFSSLKFFYPKNFFTIFSLLYLASGLGLWIIGRSAYHVGASGIVYAMISFQLFSGLLSKRREFVAISFIIIFLYGSAIWGIFPSDDPTISWEAHTAGFASGAFFSLFFYPSTTPQKKYLRKNIVALINYSYFYDFKYACSTSPEANIYIDPQKGFSVDYTVKKYKTYEKEFITNTDYLDNFLYVWTESESDSANTANSARNV